MKGRNVFKYMKPILLGFSFILGFFPSFLRNWIWKLVDLLPNVIAVGFRWSLARASGAEIGENVYIGHNVTVKNWKNLQIGSNVSIHENCFIDALARVRIGKNVSIAHASSILAFDHNYSDDQVPIKYGELIPEGIFIADDVWISAGVRILRGSEINERCIIAANAVVRGRLDPRAIYGGVPARKLKDI